jgi:hypothetical protein
MLQNNREATNANNLNDSNYVAVIRPLPEHGAPRPEERRYKDVEEMKQLIKRERSLIIHFSGAYIEFSIKKEGNPSLPEWFPVTMEGLESFFLLKVLEQETRKNLSQIMAQASSFGANPEVADILQFLGDRFVLWGENLLHLLAETGAQVEMQTGIKQADFIEKSIRNPNSSTNLANPSLTSLSGANDSFIVAINASPKTENNILHIAARSGNCNFIATIASEVGLFPSLFVSRNSAGLSPLRLACKTLNELTLHLKEQVSNIGRLCSASPLDKAALDPAFVGLEGINLALIKQQHCVDLLRTVLERLSEVQSKDLKDLLSSSAQALAEDDQIKIKAFLSSLVQEPTEDNEMHIAARSGDYSAIATAFNNGSLPLLASLLSKNSAGLTPLDLAFERLKTISLDLTKQRVLVDQFRKVLEPIGEAQVNGITSLSAQVEAADNGLHLAVRSRNYDAIQYAFNNCTPSALLFPLLSKNPDGLTPLGLACKALAETTLNLITQQRCIELLGQGVGIFIDHAEILRMSGKRPENPHAVQNPHAFQVTISDEVLSRYRRLDPNNVSEPGAPASR